MNSKPTDQLQEFLNIINSSNENKIESERSTQVFSEALKTYYVVYGVPLSGLKQALFRTTDDVLARRVSEMYNTGSLPVADNVKFIQVETLTCTEEDDLYYIMSVDPLGHQQYLRAYGSEAVWVPLKNMCSLYSYSEALAAWHKQAPMRIHNEIARSPQPAFLCSYYDDKTANVNLPTPDEMEFLVIGRDYADGFVCTKDCNKIDLERVVKEVLADHQCFGVSIKVKGEIW